MATRKRLPLPAILTANALLEGDVVYHTGSGWSRRLADAAAANDEDALERLERDLEIATASGAVVEPAIVSVSIDESGHILPAHYRERIRALGPTFRSDLGPRSRGEHDHVSL